CSIYQTPCFFSFFFFFYCYAHHRDLHSFPTRRLPISCRPCWRSRTSSTSSRSSRTSTTPCTCGSAAQWARSRGPRTTRSRPLCRSEEHTSELQSRGHLVCRLLLEKKKNYI